MKSKYLLLVGKWVLAIGLLVIVIRGGNLSFEPVKDFLKNPVALVGVFLVVLIAASMSFLRWTWILRGMGLTMDFPTAFRLGMMGQFFSIVTPGVVGGDLAKGVYLARRYPSKKARALTSLLIDRVSGLMGLILLGSIAFIVVGRGQLESLTPGPDRSLALSLGWIVFVGGLVTLTLLSLLPAMSKRFSKAPPKILDKLPLRKFWLRLYGFVGDLGSGYTYLWYSVAFAMLGHVIVLMGVYWIAQVVFGSGPWGNIDVSAFVLANVLGMCALALPLTPMGLGVGQIAYSSLFWIMGAPSKEFGGALITNLQLIQVLVGIVGIYFFATYKAKVAGSAQHDVSASI
jgi:uncharacterized membrane protein YbhN (UPF0104 family)